jgi:hypothetical protein
MRMNTQTNTDTPMMEDCPSPPCSPSSEYTGTLKIGEPHPSAREALRYVAKLGHMRQLTLMESFSSCAIDGNRLAEVCVETLRRVMYFEPVSDRYILGLAWAIRSMDFSENAISEAQAGNAAPNQNQTL